MKKIGLTLLITSTLALSACTMIDFVRRSDNPFFPSEQSSTTPSSVDDGRVESIEPASIEGDGSKDKQHLRYTMKQFNEHSAYDVDVMPSVGNPKILVIPIWFRDSSDFIYENDKEAIREEINKSIFGTNEETGWYSVKSYYYAESYGACNIEGSVTNWYHTNYSYDDITSSSMTRNLVERAVDDWKNLNPDLVKEYDTDHNGYIDGVIAIYGGPNSSNLRGFGHRENENMWAYTTWSSKAKDIESPNVKAFMWASYDFMYSDTRYVNIDTHTYIHETGHLFGLEDYYDYNDVGYWAGRFSMQDCNVGGHDPYSMLLLDWAHPYVPTESCTITLNSFESSGDIILLTPEYTGSAFDEYILIELYTDTGVNELDARHSYKRSYPSGPTYPGIRIWHIDSRLIYRQGNDYTITTQIDNNHSYYIGPSNTVRVAGSEENSRCSKLSSLEPYRQLELVRCGDYYHRSYKSSLKDQDLFYRDSTFDISRYYFNYFNNSSANNPILNNGKTLDWTVTVDSIVCNSYWDHTNAVATLTLTKNG